MTNFSLDVREDLISTVSDMYKDVHGVRPRFAVWAEYSNEQLEEWIDRLEAEIVEIQSMGAWDDYLTRLEEEEARIETPNMQDAWDRYAEYEVD